ncbi:MAG: 16S rRNA (adenine(1518)-N(6)/adenine(1519)-N(6))-dimethyltransferase [Phycisphaeraceae bacterium]|nr:16S rRNA (adenine(1518)-N(6)/adenine(1519)-N(6))-dimethyltransferase [Phycisphaeraceae bacterium]
MAQTLSEIKQLLVDHGLRPKKKFGQNFLHDGNHMARIMDAAKLTPGDTVLEVGPGTGALTERLVEAGAGVVAVEIDRDMEPILKARLGDKITLHIGDALDGKHAINAEVLKLLNTPLPAGEGPGVRGEAQTSESNHQDQQPDRPSAAPSPRPSPVGGGEGTGKPFKLIANLPYNIASPLMANLAIDHLNMIGMVVMIQKEVADRLLAPPGTKAYGPLGVLIQALFDVQRVGVLRPGCFYPPPSIDSAVVAMHRRDRPLCEDARALGELLHKLFSKRRKQLGSILGRDAELPGGVETTMRPEQLSVQQLCELAQGI